MLLIATLKMKVGRMEELKYEKKHKTYFEQVELLKKRNMIIDDDVAAENFLSNVNYYKLSGYFKFFEKEENDFANTHFQEIIDLYYFDRELRIFLMKLIEKFEIALKTKIAYVIAKNYTAFGHVNPENFFSKEKQLEFIEKLKEEEKKSKESFIINYKKKYTGEEFTPIWISVEILTLGTISRFYSNMLPKDKKEISDYFDVSKLTFESWVTVITLLRNFTAHNVRMWNRQIKPIAIKKSWHNLPYNWSRIAGQLYMLEYLTRKINPDFDFSILYNLIKDYVTKYPNRLKNMGFDKIEDIDFLR